jgi:hypothetical protein
MLVLAHHVLTDGPVYHLLLYTLHVQVDADDVDYVNEQDDNDVSGDDEDTDDIEQSELQIRSTILRKMYEAEALNINEVSTIPHIYSATVCASTVSRNCLLLISKSSQ